MQKYFKFYFITFFLSVIAIRIECTPYEFCDNVSSDINWSIKSIKISDCDKLPCILRKGRSVQLEQVFVPSHDVENLVTSVYATIFFIPLPFIGINGRSANNGTYNLDNTKAKYPLKAGNYYIYKNEFPILNSYPSISLNVYWALKDNRNIITCFEVPAEIKS